MQAQLQKTTLVTKETVERQWYHADADGQILGRLASQIAVILMGKHRPDYTPHVDTGDFVVVTNAEKIKVSGNKADTKEYDHYTYYPGGRNVTSFATMMERKPEQIIMLAVRRMLPKNKLADKMLKKLKVYRGSDHPHIAQDPAKMPMN